MFCYELTDIGLELLQKNGLAKRVDREWDKIKETIPYGAYIDDWKFDELLKNKSMPGGRRKSIEELKSKAEYLSTNPNDFFVVSGEVTDLILKKDEIRNYRRFGVESVNQLDGILATYVLSKNSENRAGLSRKPYTWRSNGFKTSIYGDIHGDLQVHQIITKPKVNKNTIDGTEVVELFGELSSGHINADYGFWPTIMSTALKYTDILNIEVPEIEIGKNY